jgi:YihY family inner membrane protein
VSTAALVPETWELSGDDARETLLRVGRRRLLADAFARLRAADGFSHARALAFTVVLTLFEGVIALVGLAAVAGNDRLGDAVSSIVERVMPGPAGQVLTQSVLQGRTAAQSGEYLGLVFGLVGALVTGTTLMGQTERVLNRLYGIERDRPSVEKYTRAFLLAVSAGLGSLVALVLVAFGTGVSESLFTGTVHEVWSIVRWPAALAFVIATMALLFRLCPRRHQPAWSWLAFGAAVGVVGWVATTGLLAVFFSASSSFGDTYGPLAGVVGLMLWALLSSVAVIYGAALAAQLEAVRAGQWEPTEAVARARVANI